MGNKKQDLKPPRGMRDFYPDDMALRNIIFDAWNRAARAFGFQEYDSCVVENLSLLKRKSGEEVVEQIYTFEDKSGRELALRPEMTPTLARMIAARQASLTFPLKWSTIAQCFRYERMTRGRKREHFQWNLDIVGEPAVAAEAEVIATALHALSSLGLDSKKVRVHFSSRALLAELLTTLGISPDHHPATFLVLDKRGKASDDDIRGLLDEAGLNTENISKVFELLSIPDLDSALGIIGENNPVALQLTSFQSILEAYGISSSVVFDMSIVRGLAYYTGIVFEAKDIEGELRAVFGGGRYDNLLADIGGKPMTGVGLGFGDVVLSELLSSPDKTKSSTRASITAIGFMSEEQRAASLRLARSLRNSGSAVDLSLQPDKAKSFFSTAAKKNCASAVYLGPDDVSSGTARIKNLDTREEKQLDLPR